MDPLHKEIIAWYKNGQPWKEGLDIFCKFNNKKKLKKRFRRSGSIPFNKGLLRFHMLEHAKILEEQAKATARAKRTKISTAKNTVTKETKPVQPAVKQVQQEQFPEPPDTQSVDFVVKPEPIQKLYLKKYELYVQAHKVRFKELPKAANQQERAALAEQVVELMRENQECWDQIREWEKSKVLPKTEKPPVPPKKKQLTPLEMQKALQNRRSNISRYRKLVKEDPEHKSTENREKKIKEWERECEFYEEQLKVLA